MPTCVVVIVVKQEEGVVSVTTEDCYGQLFGPCIAAHHHDELINVDPQISKRNGPSGQAVGGEVVLEALAQADK